MWAPKTRVCPCCRRVAIERYRVLCAYCSPLVPFDLRADLIWAFRVRTREPYLYEEALVRLYVWRNETDLGAIRREVK